MSEEINQDNYKCDECGNDITPECECARQDGKSEGYRFAFDVIRKMFHDRNIKRDDLTTLDPSIARELLRSIHYVINY